MSLRREKDALFSFEVVATELHLRGDDPVRTLSRLVKRHGVAFVKAGAQKLLTGEQWDQLVKAMTCSQSESAGSSGTRVARSRLRVNRSISKSAVLENLRNPSHTPGKTESKSNLKTTSAKVVPFKAEA